MEKRVRISTLFLCLIVVARCLTNIENDENEILSIIYNSQIGNYEHFGSAPPTPPLSPNFEDIEKYMSLDSTELRSAPIEWQNFIAEIKGYNETVGLWKKRMINLQKKIVFRNTGVLTGQEKFWMREEIDNYGIDSAFLNKPIDWKISDIINRSEYKLIEFEKFIDSNLDTVHVGIMKFSNIGYNGQKNLAIVYFDWSCGSLCGYGNVAILEKKSNIWRIKEIHNLWIS